MIGQRYIMFLPAANRSVFENGKLAYYCNQISHFCNEISDFRNEINNNTLQHQFTPINSE